MVSKLLPHLPLFYLEFSYMYVRLITRLPGRDGKGCRVSYDEIVKSVDESLKRLQTDYIDLLQV